MGIETLPWLLPVGEDFRSRCRALIAEHDWPSIIPSLVACALTMNQATRVVNALDGIVDWRSALLDAGYTRFRLGIVSNSTMDLIAPVIVATGLRYGIVFDLVSSDFDQVAQQALDPNSRINLAELDAILLALDHRMFDFGVGVVSGTNSGGSAASGFQQLQMIREGFAANSSSSTPCIVQTLAIPPQRLRGHLDATLNDSLYSTLMQFNTQVIDSLTDSVDVLFDLAALVQTVGSYDWFDDRQWFSARIAMSNRMVPIYAEHLVRRIAAMGGRSRKCLVLDLDNTLWGGVIGDDGLEGILISPGNPIGEAHLALQRYALELKNKGVVLAVCSKNEIDTAELPFNQHPDMLLQLDDIAVFVANWNDKASNLRAIAETLNIGVDSLVLVDDNPAEREQVRQALPAVAVPELPRDPTDYARLISAAGYFELTGFTIEDAQRAEQYRANAQRAQALESVANIDYFLQSLEMKISFAPFDAIGRKRIAQLINKTNQFNVTTRRYSEAQVAELEADPVYHTLQVRLTDKFGDNGMISVVICKIEGNTWEIDTWLMSCRVIKRNVEQAVCDALVAAAKARGAEQIIGHFIASPKNSLVSRLFADLGFSAQGQAGDSEIWSLELANYTPFAPPMTVIGAAD